MLLISSLLLSDEDMFMFSEICSMFSAKKILDESEGYNHKPIINRLMTKKDNDLKGKKRTRRRDKSDENES
jgi:hypothetical protein